MNSTFRLLTKLPFYLSFRRIGIPKLLPFNYTFSITNRCNSRCKTCNIWNLQGKIKKEMTTEEWVKVIKSLGKSPFWITISGGEPFVREDLMEIISVINNYNQPRIITIPTNGLLKIDKTIEEILNELKDKTNLIINFSIDGIEKEHDYIKGVYGSWKKIIEAYRQTKKLKKKYPNLFIGIHTVISKWNIERIKKIQKFLIDKLKPNQYITEIAEVRKEMKNYLNSPTPNIEDYIDAVPILINGIKQMQFYGLEKFTQAFRLEYYKYVRDFYLKKIQSLKSYAGFASTHISPIGDVWDCAVCGSHMGNLKDFNYDFKKLWKSKKASEIREMVKKSHKCILANEFYSNVLFNINILINIMKNLKSKLYME